MRQITTGDDRTGHKTTEGVRRRREAPTKVRYNSAPVSPTTFPDTEAFYLDDERRRRSLELDFGVQWRQHGVVYRLTWVEVTGEVIAVQLGRPVVRPFSWTADDHELGLARLGLGVAITGGDAGAVRVLAVVEDENELERILTGWPDFCGAEDSLVWVRRQLLDAEVAVDS